MSGSGPLVSQEAANSTHDVHDDDVQPPRPAPPVVNQTTAIDLFILAGQSNAHGYASVSNLTQDQKTQRGYFYTSWHDVTTDASTEQHYSATWETSLVGGRTRGDRGKSTLGGSAFFGPELGFVSRANDISLLAGDDNIFSHATRPRPRIGILKYAVGASSLTPLAGFNLSDWNLTTTTTKTTASTNATTASTKRGGGDCWLGFQRALADATAKLTADGQSYNFRGMIWWQGESGSSAPHLRAFLGATRDLLGNSYGVSNPSTFPIVITGTKTVWGRDLESGVAAGDPYVGFVNSEGYGQVRLDGVTLNVHPGDVATNPDVDGTGTNDVFEIGEAFANEMRLAIAGSTGSAWEPSRTKTQLWLDAADAGSVTFSSLTSEGSADVSSSGGSSAKNNVVRSIIDKSGNNHVLNAVGAVTLTPAARNGRDVLSFNGIADDAEIQCLDSATAHTTLATGRQVWYIVANPKNVDSNQDSLWSTIGGPPYITLLPNAPGFAGLWYHSGTAMGTKYSTTDLQNRYNIYEIEWNFPNNTFSTWLNGHVVNSNVVAAGKEIAFGRSNRFRFMGQYSPPGTYPSYVTGGSLAEAIISSACVDREKIEGYLAHKWGLRDDLPSNHVYKLSAP